MKKIYLILILASFLLISGCSNWNEKTDQNLNNDKAGDYVVEIASSGFSPDTLTINLGETVAFINKDSKASWPASALHPTHNVYPEKGGCIGSLFDVCRGLEQGQSWSFTFNEKGTWGYHDHLNPSLRGKIIVQ